MFSIGFIKKDRSVEWPGEPLRDARMPTCPRIDRALSRIALDLAKVVGAAAIWWALPAPAHHSHAEFSSELQVVEGELLSIAWRNPHPAMTLSVSNGDVEETWQIQVLGNINGLRRDGVTGDLFAVGERVSITGQVSRRRPALLLAKHVVFADGGEALLGPDETTGQAIYRGRIESAREHSGNEPEGIFRVWVVAERFRNLDLPLTPEARAAKDAWDVVTDDPQLGCQPLGMPGAMMSPHPIEFVERGSDIELRLEEWDAVRTIHMDDTSVGSNEAATRMGYSTGRWDDETLIVTTIDIDYAFMDEHGTPQSEAVEVVERFTLSEDERSLDWAATVTDPGTMTEPVVAFTTRWEWVPGETLQPYDCAVLDPPLPADAAR